MNISIRFPRHRVFVRASFAVAFFVAGASVATIGFAQSTDKSATARDQIWAKEKAIYASRVAGGDYYFKNASPGYLGWVYGTPRPFRIDKLQGSAKGPAKPTKEVITNEFTDFSLQGDTAIIYYVNHRTMLADGTEVDQKFDNIHVWIRDGEDWKILASMSRLEEPARDK